MTGRASPSLRPGGAAVPVDRRAPEAKRPRRRRAPSNRGQRTEISGARRGPRPSGTRCSPPSAERFSSRAGGAPLRPGVGREAAGRPEEDDRAGFPSLRPGGAAVPVDRRAPEAKRPRWRRAPSNRGQRTEISAARRGPRPSGTRWSPPSTERFSSRRRRWRRGGGRASVGRRQSGRRRMAGRASPSLRPAGAAVPVDRRAPEAKRPRRRRAPSNRGRRMAISAARPSARLSGKRCSPPGIERVFVAVAALRRLGRAAVAGDGTGFRRGAVGWRCCASAEQPPRGIGALP